jgi:hypothetical protein
LWREYVKTLDPAAQFHNPASADELARAEHDLSLHLPDDLVTLLTETNGVTGEYGLGVVWPLERIVTDNLRFRTSFRDLYMPFDGLLFFADAGNGDQFAFAVKPEGPRDEVFIWDHEDDSRRWYAASLSTYLKEWLTGERTV